MYKRKPRTARNATPSHVTTSTPKYHTGDDNDRRTNLLSQLSPLTSSQRRKEADDQIASKKVKLSRITCNRGSYFEEVVTEAGYIFQQGDSPHLLSTY
jgi:hypothetical protein